MTGGLYETFVLIHRGVMIHDYERFRLHALEFQRTIRTEMSFKDLLKLTPLLLVVDHQCSTCVAQSIKAIMI